MTCLPEPPVLTRWREQLRDRPHALLATPVLLSDVRAVLAYCAQFQPSGEVPEPVEEVTEDEDESIPPNLTPGQWRLLNIISSHAPERVTQQQIARALGKTKLSTWYATNLRVMVNRGLVEHQTRGRSRGYRVREMPE